ncbi:MAG: M48 family metalloprotease [Candidatus Heimdallarchaeota archaeon]
MIPVFEGQGNEIDQKPHIPQLLEEFDPERREMARFYRRKSRRYRLLLWILSAVLGIFVLLSRITVHFQGWITEGFSTDSFIIVATFFSLAYIVISVWDLPISFYLHIQLGRKFGLSKLTNRQWIFRYLKRVGIGYVISIVTVEVFYWILRSYPDVWWFGTALASLLFTVILANLAPILLLPRFYKFKPLADDYPALAGELIDVVTRQGVKTTDAYIWNLGETSTTGNAALLGLGNTRRIIVSDTMLEQYTTQEIKWILLHELAHFKNKDLWRGILIGSFTTLLLFFLTAQIFPVLALLFDYSTDIGNVGNIPILGLSFSLISLLVFNIPRSWYSRRLEQAADNFATSLFPDFRTIRSLFIKLGDQNLTDINPPKWETLLFASHPPIQKRIQEAQKLIELTDIDA